MSRFQSKIPCHTKKVSKKNYKNQMEIELKNNNKTEENRRISEHKGKKYG